MELFDSHCHLDSEVFDPDREAVLERAVKSGVTRFVTIGASDGIDSAKRAVSLAASHKNIWASVGMHPHDGDHTDGMAELEELSAHPRVVAVGETGLDFHYSFAGADNQFRWFRNQIHLAKNVKKPLIIHCRNAAQECLKVLTEERALEIGGVFHCYSEDAEFAKKLFDLNFIVSFPGIVTFKKSQAMRDTVKSIPLERIMLETDAPFLAPEPYRGKRCESAFMIETAKTLALVYDTTVEAVASRTTKTAIDFFRINEQTAL